MFSKKKVNTNKIDTLIGKNTKLDGTIQSKGTVRIDGTLNGDLIVDGNVMIGTSGEVFGNISCKNVIISGIIKGNVISKEQLRITNKGKLYGDIEVNNIIIDEDALFEGSCKMRNTEVKKAQLKDEKTKETSK